MSVAFCAVVLSATLRLFDVFGSGVAAVTETVFV